jgi:hypothetical protein
MKTTTIFVGAQLSSEPMHLLSDTKFGLLEKPTESQITSACLSYAHDYGLLSRVEQAALRFQAKEWLRAWQKEGF